MAAKLKRVGVGVLLSSFVASGLHAAQPTPLIPVPESAFHPVVIAEAAVLHGVRPATRPAPKPRATLAPRPRAQVRAEPSRVPKRTVNRTSGGSSSRGHASWYCNATHPEVAASRCFHNKPDVAGDQLYAAIRRDLLGHRGDYARVCRLDDPSTCVTVQVIDCNCGPNANLIDLYSDAFKRLAPLGAGNVKVSLRWV